MGELYCHNSSPSNLNKLVIPIVQGVCPNSSLLQVLSAWPSVCGHSSLCSFGILNIGLEMPGYMPCYSNTVILVFNAVFNCFLVQYLTLSLMGIQILIIIISSLSFGFFLILFIPLTCKTFGGVCNQSMIMGT